MLRIVKIAATVYCLLGIISCSNTNANEAGSWVSVDSAKLYTNKDYNKILFFAMRNDTLFCSKEGGILYYDEKQDCWLLAKTGSISDPNAQIKKKLIKRQTFPKGYECWEYANYYNQHDSYYLITHFDGGAGGKHEIVDTVERKIIRLPYEHINDFYIDHETIWTGSNFGLSKINTKTNERTTYLSLPAHKEIKNTIDLSNAIYYLDFHYGLFKYDKSTKTIEPINEVNNYCKDLTFKFNNFRLVDDSLLIITGSPTLEAGDYLNGKALLITYNILTEGITVTATALDYLDSFTQKGKYIICFGSKTETYEGGEAGFYGGAVAFDYKERKAYELTNIPIFSLTLKNNHIEATSIQKNENFLVYEKIKLFENYSFPTTPTVEMCDTFYHNWDYQKKDGDTTLYDGKVVVINNKQYSHYSELEQKALKHKKASIDSTVITLHTKHTMIKINRKKVETDRY